MGQLLGNCPSFPTLVATRPSHTKDANDRANPAGPGQEVQPGQGSLPQVLRSPAPECYELSQERLRPHNRHSPKEDRWQEQEVEESCFLWSPGRVAMRGRVS